MTVGSVNPAKPAGTVAITTAASTSVAASLPDIGDALVITNSTNGVVFIKVGQIGLTASANDYPVLASSRALISAGPYINAVAVFAPTGSTSGTVYATVIDGTQY